MRDIPPAGTAPERPLGVYTAGEHCKKCYSCVRICPTKAIVVHSGEANIIAEKCISCGYCVGGCSQGAKKIRSSVAEVAALLESGRRLLPRCSLHRFPPRSPASTRRGLREPWRRAASPASTRWPTGPTSSPQSTCRLLPRAPRVGRTAVHHQLAVPRRRLVRGKDLPRARPVPRPGQVAHGSHGRRGQATGGRRTGTPAARRPWCSSDPAWRRRTRPSGAPSWTRFSPSRSCASSSKPAAWTPAGRRPGAFDPPRANLGRIYPRDRRPAEGGRDRRRPPGEPRRRRGGQHAGHRAPPVAERERPRRQDRGDPALRPPVLRRLHRRVRQSPARSTSRGARSSWWTT